MEGKQHTMIDREGIQKHLARLERDVLRCKVCRNHLSNATCLAGCGHSFCRQCVTGKAACPECHVPISNQKEDIASNLALNEVVRNFQQLPMVHDETKKDEWMLYEFTPSSSSSEEQDMFVEYNMPKALSGMFQSLSCQYCGDLLSNAICMRMCGHSFCSFCIRRVFQNNTTGVHRQENMCITCRTETGKHSEKQIIMNLTMQHAVLHFKDVLRSFHGVNNNNTRTTSRTTTRRPAEEPISTRLPSRNYDKMKLRDMKELCRQYGLSDYGNEQTVRNRIKLFRIKWISETQSICPKTPSELLKEMSQMESALRAEEIQAFSNGNGQDSTYLRKITTGLNHKEGAAGDNVTSGNNRFDSRFQENFNKLLKQNQESRMQQQGKSFHSEVSSGADQGQGHKQTDPLEHDTVSEPDQGSDVATQNMESNQLQPVRAYNDACSPESPNRSIDSRRISVEVDSDDDPVVMLTEHEAKPARTTARPSGVDTANKENDSSSTPPVLGVYESIRTTIQSSDNGTQCNENEAAPSVRSSSTTPSTKRPSPRSQNVSSSKGTAGTGSSKGRRAAWTCQVCTFINDGKLQNVCGMCTHLRERDGS